MTVNESERRKLWVRAGGRCTLCKQYLLEGNLTSKEVFVGEAAHIVGQKNSANSARGIDSLPQADRDLAENLLLACSSCHTEIDKLLVADLIDKEFLRQRKQEHEDEIRHQTSLTKSRRTVILRMAGDIRGDRMELPKDTAVEAVVKSGGRFPVFPEAYDQKSIEIDLRDIDDEHPEADPKYYQAATAKINNAIDLRVRPGILTGDIQHLSVFAIARLPLLIYLGTKLDDGIATEVYQRQRSTQNWVWSNQDPGTTFDIAQPRDGNSTDDAVLITNLSGTTPLTDLPAALDSAPVFQTDPKPGPAEDLFAHPAVLARFEDGIRAFFTGLERTHKHLQRIHVLGAMPVSPAVTLGRILKSPGLRPSVVTYDRTDGGYVQALKV